MHDVKEETLFWNIVTGFITRNSSVAVEELCFSVVVVNIGAVAMTVNGIPLAAPVAPSLLGESFTFGAHKKDIFRGRIDVGFTGGAGRCAVIQNVYLDYGEKQTFKK